MKKHLCIALITAFACLYIMSCSSPNPTTNNNTNSETPNIGATPIVGNDADEHGCRASAGYQWSVLKNECIQIFNAGVRLDPQAKHLDATLSAFVVFKSDSDDSKAEVYIPTQKKALIFNKTSEKSSTGVWSNDSLTLQQSKGIFVLTGKNKTILYQSAVMR